MARRLLSALILAVLAVAWPAAADGDGTQPAEPGSDGAEAQASEGNATAGSNATASSNSTRQEEDATDSSSASAVEVRGLPTESAGVATAVMPARPELILQVPRTPQCGSVVDIYLPNQNTTTNEALTETVVVDDEGCLDSTVGYVVGFVLDRLPPPRVVIGFVAMFL